MGLAASIFFASGVAALVYQVIWQRILGIFSGLHISSVTIIVTAFMAGLGSGSLVGGKLADRLSRRAALGVFAACELAICVFGLISPWLYYDVVFERLGFLVHHAVALPLLHFVLLLVPTFLMGASLPLLAKGLVLRTERAATVIGLLYGVNTLGAALGALTTAWILIGAVGFVGTIRIAALLNLLAAAGALWMRGGLPVSSGAEPTADARRAPSQTPLGARPSFGLGAWSAIYAFGGFVALSLELFWFRLLDVSIKASPYTFGHLLGIYLGFLALGSLVGSLVLGFLVLYMWRTLYHGMMRRVNLNLRVLILGSREPAHELAQLILDQPEAGFEVFGMVPESPREEGEGAGSSIDTPSVSFSPMGADVVSGSMASPRTEALILDTLPLTARKRNGEATSLESLEGEGSLLALARDNQVDVLVVALEDRRLALPIQDLLHCRLGGRDVREREEIYEQVTGKIAVAAMRPSYLIFNEGFRRHPWIDLIKRGTDVALSLLILAVTSPLILLTAIAVALDSPGPILFRQERVGQD
ncbi:MAG: fused MFS/spermidine synthase, partial [Myxococcota bacterium]|nr:fused MFS/spermidine synthase [Myxococcota bacterium]